MEVGGLELERPEPESVLNPPKGRKRWVIAFCCFIINFANTLVISMVVMAKGSSSSWGSDKKDDIMDAYVIVVKFGVPVAAVLMVWVGYRVTAMVGGAMVGGALLATSFLDGEDAGAIGLLVAGVAGTGHAFLKLSAIVPVLEYFIKNRILGIVFVYLGEVIAAIIVVIIAFGYQLGIEDMKDLDLEWRTLYRYQLIPIIIATIFGAFLSPLDLRLDNENSSVLKRILGIASWKKLQGFLLPLVLLMTFLYTYGKDMPSVIEIAKDRKKDIESEDQIVVAFATPVGQFIGMGVLLFFTKKRPPILWVFVLLAGVNVISGMLTCIAPALEAVWIIFAYGMAFGYAQSIFDNLLDNTVPKMFGRQHIRIVEGVLGLAAGLGEIAATRSEDNVREMAEKSRNEYKAVFYFAGALIIAAGLVAAVSVVLIRRDKDRQNFRNDDDDESD